MSKKFLSKDNITKVILGIIIGLIVASLSFIAGRMFTGPEKVQVIRDTNSAPDTTVFSIEGDSTFLKMLKDNNKLLSQVLSRANAADTLSEKAKSSDVTKTSKTDSLQSEEPILSTTHYDFPDVIKGYTKRSIDQFANVSIFDADGKRDGNTYSQGEKIYLRFEIKDKSIIGEVTPAFVQITKQIRENARNLIFDRQFGFGDGTYTIPIMLHYPEGKYKLTAGFYFKDELDKEFPPKYLEEFEIVIQ